MLQDFRHQLDPLLAEIDPELILVPLRHGIAPAMSSDTEAPFWGWSMATGPSTASGALIWCKRLPKQFEGSGRFSKPPTSI